MAEINLTQAEADRLLLLDKFIIGDNPILDLPNVGQDILVNCISLDKREEFILDCSRGTIKLSKIKHQLRARKVVPLIRLDINSSPHKNPDGTEVGPSHMHIYKEGYADKYAFDVPSKFTNLNDMAKTLLEFMSFCNIKNTPQVNGELF